MPSDSSYRKQTRIGFKLLLHWRSTYIYCTLLTARARENIVRAKSGIKRLGKSPFSKRLDKIETDLAFPHPHGGVIIRTRCTTELFRLIYYLLVAVNYNETCIKRILSAY